MKDLFDLANQVGNLSAGALVILSTLLVGYAVRRSPLSNKWIPTICMGWGVVVMFALALESRTAEPFHYGRTFITGFILGGGTWVLHAVIISRFEDKIPGLKRLLGEEDAPPAQLTGRQYDSVADLMKGEGIPQKVQDLVNKSDKPQ